MKNGSDCIHLNLRALPGVRRNVFVHVHDIYLLGPLPKSRFLKLHALAMRNPVAQSPELSASVRS